ncbi:MAG TPA: hypothetical protein VI731_05050 [Bacteroidia bacterium]|nr:hypothetical protein [Bacteroidia bacterium]
MNFIRTNQTLHISQLIGQALPAAVNAGEIPIVRNNGATVIHTTHLIQAGEDGPVSPTERVPYSSSHQLVRERSASSLICPGTTGPTTGVAAA